MLVKEPVNKEVRYKFQLVKLAWLQYKSMPEDLDADTLAKLEKQAMLAQQITEAVLATPEAQSQDYPRVTEQEALTYYENNSERFSRPERRKVSHILITVNDEYEENQREKALAKVEKLANRLKDHIKDFANLALQHSECPTALNNGLIGDVSRGQLYPELDLVLFNMQVNQISSVIETELGFHLIVCHEILAAGEIEKQDALQQITTQLNEHRQKKLEKKWISNLFATEKA